MSCDVFISYRREDGTYPALILHRDLIDSGYDVFYDIANIRNGQFPAMIEENIRSCTDFLLLVTHCTFNERIFDPNDWIRKEIRLAIENEKNIIPIFIGDARIPDDIPEDIAKVSGYNGVFQIDPHLIHDIYKKMFREYLHSPFDSADPSKIVRRQCSIYDATYGDEFERLKIQSNNSYFSDMDVINKSVCKEKPIAVLDVGCAYGFVGKTRFEENCFNKVVGIDKNEKCVSTAETLNDDPRFSYHVVDIESMEFENELKCLMEKLQIEKFDVVYVALVIHHLKEPIKFLKCIKKYIDDKGIIIIRGSDDGSKLAYNDHGFMNKIINLTTRVPNVSDRFNGRKIFHQLKLAGFRDIKMHSYMKDISNFDYDERELLFNESFSYRINYARRYYEADPNNREKRELFYQMEELLAQFQECFFDSSFWYCEYDYIAVAKKKY